MTRKAKAQAATANKAPPASLGRKRLCPKCSAKFYDFEKPEVACPKCRSHLSFDDDSATDLPPPPAPKKPRIKEIDDEPVVAIPAATEEIETLDDLAGGEEEVIEEIETDDEQKEDY